MPLSYYIYTHVYKHLLKLYLKRDSSFTIDGLHLTVLKGVFHPRFFFSTRYFYDFIKNLELSNRRVLDVGCGAGALSLLAAKKGATVTALDISPKAVENTLLNFKNNFEAPSPATVIQSDLFNRLPAQRFDVIVINPPYFFKSPGTESENAWYCGPNGEYFENLFANLFTYSHSTGDVFMILADNCDIARIKRIALKHNIALTRVEEKKIRWEMNYIFKLHENI